jgi:hypothetical protein
MKTSHVAALLVATLVAACGGGGESASPFPPATAQVPPSASASADGFISYLKALVASAADMLEPVDTSGVTPPTDEVSEPQKVD